MKRVTASEARKHWFRLLDEVATGEVVMLERKGRRIVVRRDDAGAPTAQEGVPAYRRVLIAPDADDADRWTWEWQGPEHGLATITRKKR